MPLKPGTGNGRNLENKTSTAETISVSTKSRTELIDVTPRLVSMVKASGISSGICHIFVPHTTAGLTINENADPSVRRDVLKALERIAPYDMDYEHAEGNSAAHVKSVLVGNTKTLFIEDGQLRLGTWQGVFFCEFDGPRQREVFVKLIEA